MKDAPLLNWTNFDPYRCSGPCPGNQTCARSLFLFFFFLNSHKVDKKNSSPVLSSQAESSLSFPVSPRFPRLGSARANSLRFWPGKGKKRTKKKKSLRAMLEKRWRRSGGSPGDGRGHYQALTAVRYLNHLHFSSLVTSYTLSGAAWVCVRAHVCVSLIPVLISLITSDLLTVSSFNSVILISPPTIPC